jgi:hypothetical protein
MMMLSRRASSPPVLQAIFTAWVLLLSPMVGHATDWGIDQLMHSLAKTRSGHARFAEEKSIAMLDAPVTSSGELFYRAPDYLERRTFTPRAESMTVDGNDLLIERDDQEYRLQLQDYPELAAFIDSIRGTLAGNRLALERNYRLSLEGGAEDWILQLLPVDEKMQAVVRRIRITGVDDEVRTIEIAQADGDNSLMRIEKLDTP